MKPFFFIEMFSSDKSVTTHFVKGKTYEECCVKLAKIYGEPNAFKLLGLYEASTVDKDIINRYA